MKKKKQNMDRKPKVSYYGISNMGRVRANNEDAFVAQYIWDENTVLAVAIDGVGGYEGGEVAADIARRTIPEYLSASPNGERVELLKQAVTAANNAIFDTRASEPEHSQMSCVLTAVIVDVAHRQVSMAHVGDSRLYSFQQGTLKKLSHDHSLIGYREEIGDLTEEEAMHHPQRNVIGRDVGSERHKTNDEEFIESQVFPLLPNTILLLCSDGLTDMITSAVIKEILGRKKPLEDKAKALVDAALDAGGKDNVTVVLVEFLSNEPEPVLAKKGPAETSQAEPIAKQPEAASKVPVKTLGKNRFAPVACLAVGLAIGGVGSFAVMNGRMNRVMDEKEQQETLLKDSISRLHEDIGTLNIQIQELSQDTLATENTGL